MGHRSVMQKIQEGIRMKWAESKGNLIVTLSMGKTSSGGVKKGLVDTDFFLLIFEEDGMVMASGVVKVRGYHPG